MALLEIAQIRTDGGTQPRAYGTEYSKVQEYAELMRDGKVFPPLAVTFDGTYYWLVDGFHRLEAAQDAELQSIECDITAGALEDAQWQSYSVNATHGLPRTSMDKRRAVKAALSHAKGHELSDRAIAEHVGCDHKTVGAVRRELEALGEVPQAQERTGRDGQVRNVAPAAPWSPPSAPGVPEDGWPEPGEGGIYDDAEAELLVEPFGRGQRLASINLLRVADREWAIGWSVSLSEKGGVAVNEPLQSRLRWHGREDAVKWAAKEIIQWCRKHREGRPESQLKALDHFVTWAMELAGFTDQQVSEWDLAAERERHLEICHAAEALMTPLIDLPISDEEFDLPAGIELRDVVKAILCADNADSDDSDWFRSDAEQFLRRIEPVKAILERVLALINEEKACAA